MDQPERSKLKSIIGTLITSISKNKNFMPIIPSIKPRKYSENLNVDLSKFKPSLNPAKFNLFLIHLFKDRIKHFHRH